MECLSSMATRALLTELGRAYQHETGRVVSLTSLGGVEAAQRVAAGEVFDVVVLARDAIAKLTASGHLQAQGQVDFVRSRLAVAVRAGREMPALGTREELERALLETKSIGYSTGPSGVALAQLFAQWGLAEVLRGRIVVAPPGVPVGSLVARGEVELGFQQRAELIHVDGLQVLTALPPELDIVTVFSAALTTRARSVAAATEWLAYLTSPTTSAAKERHGLEAA